jgi:hypothetical protein
MGATEKASTTGSKPLFEPDRLAYLEIAGWRAYYERAWPKMLKLLVELCREQFNLSPPRALQAAYYVLRASMAWKPANHDLRTVRYYLRKFYQVAQKHGKQFHFSPKEVADLELRYWIMSRKYSGTPWTGTSPLVNTMAELHAALFGISREAALPSGRDRARSLHTVGHINAGRSTDVEGDWQHAEEYLREGYRSLLPTL